MGRLRWFAAGVAAGAYGLFKAKRTAQNFTPTGLQSRAAALGAGAQVYTREVADRMRRREAELRERMQLDHAVRGPEIEPIQAPNRLREDTSDGHR
jgi:uncharacterized protein DUF6167